MDIGSSQGNASGGKVKDVVSHPCPGVTYFPLTISEKTPSPLHCLYGNQGGGEGCVRQKNIAHSPGTHQAAHDCCPSVYKEDEPLLNIFLKFWGSFFSLEQSVAFHLYLNRRSLVSVGPNLPGKMEYFTASMYQKVYKSEAQSI